MSSSLSGARRRPLSPAGLRARAAVIAAAVCAILATTLLAAVPASAHDELVGASPAAGAQIDALPDELVLTFSGVLMDESGATEVVVTDAAGTDLTAGDPALSGTRLRQPLAARTDAGTVTVTWRVVSSDGHPVSGQYTFTVGDGATQAPPATPTSVPGPPMGGTDMTWLLIVGGVVLIGAAAALAGVLIARSRPRRED